MEQSIYLILCQGTNRQINNRNRLIVLLLISSECSYLCILRKHYENIVLMSTTMSHTTQVGIGKEDIVTLLRLPVVFLGEGKRN